MRILLFILLLMATQASAFRPTVEPGQPWVAPPEITCPADVTVSTDPFACVATFNYTVTATDDQPGWTLTQTTGLATGSAFPVGATVNQFTVTDTDGGSATCSFTVEVHDYVPPVAVCQDFVTVNLPLVDNPNDCYDGAVASLRPNIFDGGSVDNCGLPVKFTIQRQGNPYSDCTLALNPTNGHPDCDDAFPDFPSEFERAISEAESMKIYCCEANSNQNVILRVYQTEADGSLALGADGQPIFNSCFSILHIVDGPCPDSATSLAGKVLLDVDGNCLADTNVAGLHNQLIRAISAGGDTLYTSTSEDGSYRLQNLAVGLQDVTILPVLPGWNFCNAPASVTIPPAPSVATLYDIYAQPTTECPLLQVNITSNFVRPCRNSTWSGYYCNLGGETAINAYVDLVVPTPFSWVSASNVYTIIGDTIRIQLDTVAPGDCGSFYATLTVPCDTNLLGENLCVDAHIYPDEICIPAESSWSGAQIQASTECTGDSIRFIIRNTGIAATTQALDYVIIDDMVIRMESTLPANFQPGDTHVETIAVNGDGFRLNVQQEPGHPSLFTPSVQARSCAGGPFFQKAIQDFANEDGSFFTDFKCRLITGSYDPNEKLAIPRGFADEHYIEPNTPLVYQIGFQNTGNDTAFLVVLRDTLSPLLDPSTLRMTNNSHPYDWSLDNNGHLEVRFRDILLPDSTTNEVGSHGFIQFSIGQKHDNPIGSLLTNKASIYFDINSPVVTNTVWHTIGHEFVPTALKEPKNDQSLLRMYPNPAIETSYLVLQQNKDVQVRVVNVLGKEVQRYNGKAPGIQLQRAGLPEGMYWIEVAQGGRWQAAGKLIWQP